MVMEYHACQRPRRISLFAVMGKAMIIAALALGLLAPASGATAQSSGKLPRIGFLTISLDGTATRVDAFRQGLREQGYVEGQNVVVDYRSAEGSIERLPELAADLVRLKPDVIVAVATPAARAARQATKTIPIVATSMGDPINDGLVASLARPGGNVTGTTFLGPELVPKLFELIKEGVPSASRVGGLLHVGAFSERTTEDMLGGARDAARRLGVHFYLASLRSPEDLDRAFEAMSRERVDALVVLPSPMLFSVRKRIVDLAAKHRLPTIFNARESVDLGGMMAYGASIGELNRRSAVYVDKILKGAKPADLPVEQPTIFQLSINLRTAQALGLKIPQSVLFRADHVLR